MIVEHDNLKGIEVPSTGKYAIMFHLPGHCAGCSVALKILQRKKLENITIELIDAGADENGYLIERFGASTAPTVIVFENGRQTATMAGLKEFQAKHLEVFGE